MRVAEVRKQIAAGSAGPLYLLEGDDPQSRLELAHEFAALVDEGLEAFNVQHFHATEAGSAAARDQLIVDLLSAARTLPMMAPRRVLIVHAAERLLSPRKAKDEDADPPPDPGGRRKRGTTPVEDLEAYLAAPEPLTTLLFLAADLDGNRRLVKLVRKHAVAVDCGTLENTADAAKWVRARLEREKMSIEPAAVSLLIEATGVSLGRLRGEVEKLLLFAAGEPAVTAAHVRELVMPQAEPGQDFALGRAIWNSDARAALREIESLFDDGMPPFMILGQIRAAAARVRSDARVREGLDAVFETDLAIKSSAGDSRYLLERLVIDLCGRR